MSDKNKKEIIRQWMTKAYEGQEGIYGSAFDLAVDCTYDLKIWVGDYEIPEVCIEIAESIMGEN